MPGVLRAELETAPELTGIQRRDWLTWLAMAVGCFLLSELSLATPVEGQGTALFWLAAGLNLGALIQLSYRAWPGALTTIFVVCLVSNRFHDIPCSCRRRARPSSRSPTRRPGGETVSKTTKVTLKLKQRNADELSRGGPDGSAAP
jgi:hypothetical protein